MFTVCKEHCILEITILSDVTPCKLADRCHCFGRICWPYLQDIIHCDDSRLCAWLVRRVLDWMIEFIAPYTFTQLGTTCNYRVIAYLHTLQFTAAYALGFPVFTSRILATDLSQSHCRFKSHMKCSFHSLIPFLSFCNHLRLLTLSILCCNYQLRNLTQL
jgi:hypothetical protein